LIKYWQGSDVMENDKTTTVNTKNIIDENTRITLRSVCSDLEERGYNPTKQIVAYLVSGDPGYISSHKEARNKITLFDRTKILEILVEDFLTKK
jgi:uncharacterized protein (UPF0297 family)